MGLRDKASKIDFASLPEMAHGDLAAASGDPTAPTGSETKRPKTAPGAMMAFAGDQRSELLKENETLKAKAEQATALQGQLGEALNELKTWEGAKPTRLIDPKHVFRTKWANRHEINFQSEEYARLKDEISSAGGNVQAVKVRPATSEGDDGAPRYELVYGHRRHQACLELGLPLLAVVDNLDDRSLFVEMDRENRGRKDLSPWEQGVMYQRALDQGLFPSNRKLAEAVGADLTNVGRALVLANLPEAVVAAFQSPLELQYRWAMPLKDAIEADGEAVDVCAKEIGSTVPSLSPKEVFERLTASKKEGGSTVLPPASLEIQVAGRRAAIIQLTGKGGMTVSIEPGLVAADKLKALADLVEKFLLRGKSPKGGR
jgi:ParB family chromosome partitioning protein